jgi:hypothetical protein
MLTGVVAENGNSLIGVSVRPAFAQLAKGKAPAAPINVRRVSVKPNSRHGCFCLGSISNTSIVHTRRQKSNIVFTISTS